jgi:hypothetical protein
VQYYIEPTTGFLLIDSLLTGDKGPLARALHGPVVFPSRWRWWRG